MKLEKVIDLHFNDFKEDLSLLVGIDSVLDEKGEKPFGIGIQKALEAAVSIAKRMGFKTFIDPEGYYAYAEIGSGEKLFGVLGHLDVVPVGDLKDWKTNPFELVENDGKLYGRGSTDDKGPLLASMHALKLLLDEGYSLNQRVRFIFGTDEESLWRCMKAYTKTEEIPSAGFTPDSSFPLTYAEKGLIEFTLSSKEESSIKLEGGGPLNAVPSQAYIDHDETVVKALKEMGVRYEIEADGITVYGKAMHAMAADEGENALIYAAQALYNAGKKNRMIEFMVEKLANPNGKLIYGEVSDDVSGKLMLNVGKSEFTKDTQTVGIDMRFPVTFDRAIIDEKLIEQAKEYGVEVELFDFLPSIYIERDSELVKGLMKAYQNISNDMVSEPRSSGGATYARAMDNVVAYGASFPHSENTEHQANENIVIEDIKKAMRIYMEAYLNLVIDHEA